MTAPTPLALLVAARTALDRPGGLGGSAWARSTALLTRQALEGALAAYWSARAPGMESCSAKCQLLALPFYVDDPNIRAAHQTWAALSNACHHHAYDLSPTAVELRDWLDTSQAVVDTLTQATIVPG
jgi:hypothetical protein